MSVRNNPQIERLEQYITAARPVLASRDARYRGKTKLHFAADEISGDLARLSVNLCKLAVDAVAERMRVEGITAAARGRDLTPQAESIWRLNDLDQLLQATMIDALAMGVTYLSVWADRNGQPRVVPEPAIQVGVEKDPVTGDVVAALKRWNSTGPAGEVENEFATLYQFDKVTVYRRRVGQKWQEVNTFEHALGAVPVVQLLNLTRLGDTTGSSVIDDLGPLVDALVKVLVDMLVSSEDVARPRRWATGVDMEERSIDGFTADGPVEEEPSEIVSPFESGNRMFTVESPDAKFGQLPGADLKGYETAVNLLLQQIMAVSALPAHMMGVTTSNPASADAIRAAEAGITARAESRIKILSRGLEKAMKLALSIETGIPHYEIEINFKWGSAATRSVAQETDAITKLHALGIVTTAEAREKMGIDSL